MTLDRELYNALVDFLVPHFGTARRQTWLEGAFHGSRLLQWINYDGSDREFTTQLVVATLNFGEIEPGTPAIVWLLQHMCLQLGVDRQAQIDDLIGRISSAKAACSTAPYLPQLTEYLTTVHQFNFTWVRLDDRVDRYFLARGNVGWMRWHVVIVFSGVNELSPQQTMTFSERCYQHVNAHKVTYGIHNNVIVVPVLLGCGFTVQEIPFGNMVAKIGLYGVQLPVICDLDEKKLHYSPKTPPLGIAYVPTVRKEVVKILQAGFASNVK